MTQEDINDLLNGKQNHRVEPLKKCPICGENYFGDGTNPCLDCRGPWPETEEV